MVFGERDAVVVFRDEGFFPHPDEFLETPMSCVFIVSSVVLWGLRLFSTCVDCSLDLPTSRAIVGYETELSSDMAVASCVGMRRCSVRV